VHALVEAGEVNAYRTAAADALAARHFARTDAGVLALFGAGHQAFHEALAIAGERSLSAVLVVNRNGAGAETMADRLRAEGFSARVAAPEEACRAADIIVTVTASRAPLFDADWVKPGTHVASMGSDGPGKQELPSALFERAALIADLPSQSVRFGEFQHLPDALHGGAERIISLGDVLAGRRPGRRDSDEITIFDSSGLALQDLFVAKAILDRAIAEGLTHAIPS
jgi:ornithine cyclodeaminase